MIQLPYWHMTNSKPAFFDTESATAIEQTAKLYAAMQDLINEYNKFAETVNIHITELDKDTDETMTLFSLDLRQEFQDFIDVINLKAKSQDKYIKESLQDELIKFLQAYRDSGELTADFEVALNDIILKISNEASLRNSNDMIIEKNLINETDERKSNDTKLLNSINQLNSRVNSLSSLPEGSTTGDAELIDIRTAYDGSIFPTAGDSVRSQFLDLDSVKKRGLLKNSNKTIINLFDDNKVTFGKGWIFATSTNAPFLFENDGILMTDFIEVNPGDDISIYQPNVTPGAYTIHITEYSTKTSDLNDMLNIEPSSVAYSSKVYNYSIQHESTKYIRVVLFIEAGTPVISKNIPLGTDGDSNFFDFENDSFFDDFEIAKLTSITLGQCDGINLFNFETCTDSGITLDNGLKLYVTDFIDCYGDDIFICNFIYKNISYAVNFYDSTSDEKIAQTVINHKRSFNVPSWCKRVRICFTESEKNIFEIYRIRQKKLLSHNSIDFFGDSIVQGYVGFINDEHTFAHPTWIDNIEARTGVICVNHGIGSTGYSVNSLETETNTVLDVAQSLSTRKNYACIWAGTNDWAGTTLPLGTIDSERGSESIYGRIKETFYQIGLLYEGRVLVITPMKRADYNLDNAHGYKLIDICKAIEDVAKNVNYPVLNLYEKLPVGGMNFHLTTTDGLHPNQYCINSVITPVILDFIKTYVN